MTRGRRPEEQPAFLAGADYGFVGWTGRGRTRRHWYRNPATGRYYVGPRPPAAVVRGVGALVAAPAEADCEPCPWTHAGSTDPELIAIPGPPEVLFNKRGLTLPEAVHDLEDAGMVRATRLLQEQVTRDTPLTLRWVRRLHRVAFEALYPWAGRYRSVTLSKADPIPWTWGPPGFIPEAMAALEADHLRVLTPARHCPHDQVAARVARLLSEFLVIHPFREGNGRIARLIGDWVALQAGLPPIAYGIDDHSEAKLAYVRALHHGYAGRYEPLTDFVQQAIARGLEAAGPLKGPGRPPVGAPRSARGSSPC